MITKVRTFFYYLCIIGTYNLHTDENRRIAFLFVLKIIFYLYLHIMMVVGKYIYSKYMPKKESYRLNIVIKHKKKVTKFPFLLILFPLYKKMNG